MADGRSFLARRMADEVESRGDAVVCRCGRCGWQGYLEEAHVELDEQVFTGWRCPRCSGRVVLERVLGGDVLAAGEGTR